MTYGDGVADVDITASIEFHKQHNKAVTLTSVQPVARFGALGLKDTQIYSFQEKPPSEGGWVNGGFFVLNTTAIDAVTDDVQMFEREPIESLVSQGEVHAFFHHGFWQAMDTFATNYIWKSYGRAVRLRGRRGSWSFASPLF